MSSLSGIRVIDFGQYVAGPAVAMMFADLGAEVIRVDPPGGTMWKSPAARVLNRGKRRICLDLKARDDLDIAQALILSADVVIENFRPGVMDRLGLGPDWARKLNPSLVYLSMPGFSSVDPEFKDVQAWEGVIAAASGQFTDMGLNRVLMGINPSFSPITLASAYAATLGATGVAAALYARETTGLGDWIEAPIAACLMEGLAYNAMHVEDYPQRYKSLRERERDRRIMAGDPMDLSYQECQEFCDPFYRVYRCADGPFYRCYKASDGWLFLAIPETCVDALGDLNGLEDIATLQPDIQTERLAMVIATKPRSAWQADVAALGGCAIALGSLQELRVRYARNFAEEITASQTFQFVRDSSHPCDRTVTLVDWSGIRPDTLPIQHGTPAPKYGANTRSVLTELGYQSMEIEQLLGVGTVSESWSKDYMPT